MNTEEFAPLSREDADALVEEHRGWAESIARSVARAWNLDWQLDGLDGAAMEALIFCARRFQPTRGVPFRGYARRRIHEASTEAARKSRGWKKRTDSSPEDQRARDVSAELFNVFPELRSGELPLVEEGLGDGSDDMRSAVRNLLVGASVIALKQSMDHPAQDDVMDIKKMVRLMAQLEPVHQTLLWEVYWEGNSMRTLATTWKVDELSVIREHKTILVYLQRGFSKQKPVTKLKVRPALKEIGLKLRKGGPPPFARALERGAP